LIDVDGALFFNSILGQGKNHIPDTSILNTASVLPRVAPEPTRSCGSKKPRWSDSFCRNDYISDAGSVAGCLGIAVSQTCRSLDIRRNSKAHSHRFLAGAAHNRRNRSWRQGFWCRNVRMFSGLCSFYRTPFRWFFFGHAVCRIVWPVGVLKEKLIVPPDSMATLKPG
jgi:hypothetical protein